MHSIDDNFQQLSKSMQAMMEGISGPSYFGSSGRDSWDPPLNVYELSQEVVVCVELAGINPGDIELHVEDDILHIRGYRSKPVLPDPSCEVGVHLMEIDSGKFHRKVPVPPNLDFSGCTANYRNGYVWIILPKNPSEDSETTT